ncbi:carboxyl transferase domain-containing protein [Microbacterium sp. KHB019]|uniref:carboxyl transferase domain-containing protein n=1 Tax=Microbacterium sp. KHB019 TaxID=3129770 RepID=UPI0030791100
MSGVLIANRGEVALRIIRACAAVGLRSITTYTADERDSVPARAADHAVLLPGEGPAAYLDVHALVAAARDVDADFVHPGYGFLSENAEFARALSVAGIAFVGPDAETLSLFGDKIRAIELARGLGVPVLADSGPIRSFADAERFLAAHPGPVIVKAAAGGGGRGIRVVRDPAQLEDLLARAASEAENGFGDDTVYIESYIPRARHIEVQIVGDGHDVRDLGTRDCSIQRRHQKVLEFAPAPDLPAKTEAAMTSAALEIARAVGYRGLGTVEFLLSVDTGSFSFMELNPRLQVEHGVTELVTGTDLVALQLRLARGEQLDELGVTRSPEIRGVAAEARIASGSGTLVRFRPPEGPRIDTSAEEGAAIVPGFDPLLAKVLVTASRWSDAVSGLRDAVSRFEIDGVETNVDEVMRLLDDPRVSERRLTTSLADDLAVVAPASSPAAPELRAATAGTVIEVPGRVGDVVRAGAVVVVVEAMKMQHEVAASGAARIEAIDVVVGDRVEAGQLLGVLVRAEAHEVEDAVTVARATQGERDDLRDNHARHERTLDAARPDAVDRRHAAGKRTARENVADLFDGEFVEHGALVIAAQRRRRSLEDLEQNTPADGVVAGFGDIEHVGQTAVLAYDYSVLAGTQGIQSHKKSERLFELARRRGTPVVVYAEGGGGRPGDTDNDAKATGMDLGTFVAYGRLSGVVPTVAIASGRCFAGTAALVGASDLVIATLDANIGMGGPAMIEGAGLGRVTAEEIGPARTQYANGSVDVLVADEAEATAVARRYLSYFSGARTAWSAPDQTLLRDIVPENRARVFDMRSIIRTLADFDSVLELRAGFAPGVVTALARIDGAPVGIVANDGAHLGGAIDGSAADKMTRFLRLCDGYGIPIVTLCDTPGFLVGPESEDAAAVRHIGRLFVTAPNLTVPLCTVVVRRAWGLGGQAMAGGSFRVPDAIVAWPTAEFGAMGPEGAVRLGYRRELEAIEDPAEREQEFRRRVDEYVADGKGHRAASVFEIDDVIDPVDTRTWITASIRHEGGAPRRRGPIDTW